MRILFFMILSCILLLACNKEPGDPEPIGMGEPQIDRGNSVLPYVVIETAGLAIKNEPKIDATMSIYDGDRLIQNNYIGIEYRGSTSFRLSEKWSYDIETRDIDGEDLDTSFFGFPAEEDWLLLGHVVDKDEDLIFDRSLMYNYLGHELYRKLGRYTSRIEFVEVEVNGSYEGVYLFMEELKRDGDRIDVSKLQIDENEGEDVTGGYIISIDKTTAVNSDIERPLEYYLDNWNDDAMYTEDICWRSQYSIFGDLLSSAAYGPPYHADQYLETYFQYEYPKATEITPQQKAYIQTYFHDFETALLSEVELSSAEHYSNYIDVSSFVDYFIINELCRNVDAYRISTNLYKDKNEKLNLGPVWDFNIGFDGSGRIPAERWVIEYNDFVDRDPWMVPFWWSTLIRDDHFRSELKARWTAIRNNELVTEAITGLVDETAAYLVDNKAMQRNYERWKPGEENNYTSAISSLKTYLETRASWMDQEIAQF